MGRVFELKPKEDPHIAGNAVCLNCQRSWVAVAPVGSTSLECPDCGTMKGVFVNPVEDVGAGVEHWRCGCGNYYLLMTRTRVYCPNCGETQTGF